jgi:hypothetical protein
VSRLASHIELDMTQIKVKNTVEMVVGKDVAPFVGMRVRQISGKDHRSSRGQLGTIQIIPGRGARQRIGHRHRKFDLTTL